MLNPKEGNKRGKIDRKLNANVRILNFKLSAMITEIILPEIKCLKCFQYRSKGF